jgi:hypothetical protein
MADSSISDWHKMPLTAVTKIDSHYKNTQNVRRFFKKEIGEHFHFTREFMQYIKSNTGITLATAAKHWKKTNPDK